MRDTSGSVPDSIINRIQLSGIIDSTQTFVNDGQGSILINHDFYDENGLLIDRGFQEVKTVATRVQSLVAFLICQGQQKL
jgi:hypothetical protein